MKYPKRWKAISVLQFSDQTRSIELDGIRAQSQRSMKDAGSNTTEGWLTDQMRKTRLQESIYGVLAFKQQAIASEQQCYFSIDSRSDCKPPQQLQYPASGTQIMRSAGINERSSCRISSICHVKVWANETSECSALHTRLCSVLTIHLPMLRSLYTNCTSASRHKRQGKDEMSQHKTVSRIERCTKQRTTSTKNCEDQARDIGPRKDILYSGMEQNASETTTGVVRTATWLARKIV